MTGSSDGRAGVGPGQHRATRIPPTRPRRQLLDTFGRGNGDHPRKRGGLGSRRVDLLFTLVLLLQLALLVRRSWGQWKAGALSQDFAIFHQAWARIGSADLNPYSTILDDPYWRSHFEVLMWPLALLHPVSPSGFTLLVIQCLAIVGAEAIAVRWVLDVARQGRVDRPHHLLPAVVTLLLLVLNERIWEAARADFHFQPLATLAVLGAARAAWLGQRRLVWVWVVWALSTGDVAGTYVAGVGFSALIARRDTRRTGLALIAAGGAWTVAVGLIGASHGSPIRGYQHIVEQPLPPDGTALLVLLSAIALHPGRPLAVLFSKVGLVRAEFGATGLMGMVHPWAIGVVGVVVVSNALQESTAFFRAFQNFPAILFATVGTGLTLDWCGRRWRCSARGRRASGEARRGLLAKGALLLVVGVMAASVVGLRSAPEPAYPEPDAAAASLARVDAVLRPDDQVVASFGLVGRFAGRKYVEYLLVPRTIRLRPGRVMFVLSPTVGNAPTPDAQLEAAQTLRDLGATTIVDTPDVAAFVVELDEPTALTLPAP